VSSIVVWIVFVVECGYGFREVSGSLGDGEVFQGRASLVSQDARSIFAARSQAPAWERLSAKLYFARAGRRGGVSRLLESVSAAV